MYIDVKPHMCRKVPPEEGEKFQSPKLHVSNRRQDDG
jgi:hypothetical protein